MINRRLKKRKTIVVTNNTQLNKKEEAITPIQVNSYSNLINPSETDQDGGNFSSMMRIHANTDELLDLESFIQTEQSKLKKLDERREYLKKLKSSSN